jgi:choline dehydrogenase-like flavoprotein
MSDYDFKAASHDGYGEDWPISYADLAPYYDKVERFVGISGRKEGFETLPDGQFLPPMAFSCGEEMMKEHADRMGMPMTIGRVAVNTVKHGGHLACHYCGPCYRGCKAGSYFSAPARTLPVAEATGRFTLITNAIVRQVITDNVGLASGVVYVDKDTKTDHEVNAKTVVLCASTLESTRILLNSAPGGMANSSGVLGHYLMDHLFATGASGELPSRKGVKPELGQRPNGIYITRFQNVHDKHPDYIRGYGFQGGETNQLYEHAHKQPGFGRDFKNSVRDDNASIMNLSCFGDMLPRFDNRAYIDPEMKDAWGVPVLKIDCTHGDNELAMTRDMVGKAVELLEDMGVKNIETREKLDPPGCAIHEVGTARMGNDPNTSVLNKFNQAHDIKNLFVMDGSCYVTLGCVNVTLSMMALTVRACENLVKELRAGNLA